MSAFTDLVGCRLPLQLAGMGGGVGEPGLASAVSDAGGLGMLGAAGMPPDAVTAIITATAEATTGPFGVNFLMPFVDLPAVAAAAKAAHVIEFFYGSPDAELVAVGHDGGALAAWQVGSAEEATAAVAAGCDFVVAQGTEAGGHVRGTQPLDAVLADVRAAVDVPIVAAGGIGTAHDVGHVLELGASAVRIGTRFLAATESVAHPSYVDALISSSASDTVLTTAFSTGWPDAPHRVLRACVAAAEAAAEQTVGTVTFGGVSMPVERFATMPPTTAASGNIAAMAQYAGTSVDGLTSRRPAAGIVAELCAGI